MPTTKSPKAGERTHDPIREEWDTLGTGEAPPAEAYESTVDPVYGFLTSLRDCTFHFGEDQHELTIKAPDGGKIGLPFVDEMKAMTAARSERLARMAAPELLEACIEAMRWLDNEAPFLIQDSKCETRHDCVEQARAAIAKAEGQS